MHLIFSSMEILQLYNWSHDALDRMGKSERNFVKWQAHQTHA